VAKLSNGEASGGGGGAPKHPLASARLPVPLKKAADSTVAVVSATTSNASSSQITTGLFTQSPCSVAAVKPA